MKHIIVFFGLLFSALGASGQIYINSFTFGAAPAANLLLDDYPNAAVALSFRLLRTAYTGNCIEVRRVSDGTTSNIGFSGNYLDTAALKTFCASTDCFVRTWYDQSGSGRNAVQTTNANQPRIATNGALEYNEGNLGMFFNRTSYRLIIANSTTFSTNWWFFVTDVEAAINTSDFGYIMSVGTTVSTSTQTYARNSTSAPNANRRYVFDGGTSRLDGFNTLTTELASLYFPSTTPFIELYVDGVQETFVNTPVIQRTFSSQIALGAFNGVSNFMHGWFYEFVGYNSNVSSDRTGIEGNINSFYNIY